MFTKLRCFLYGHEQTVRETSDRERLLVCPRCSQVVSRTAVIPSRPAHETLKAKPSKPSQPASVTPIRRGLARGRSQP